MQYVETKVCVGVKQLEPIPDCDEDKRKINLNQLLYNDFIVELMLKNNLKFEGKIEKDAG